MKTDQHIRISIADQALRFYCNQTLQASYSVSTAAKGTGQSSGSFCTPLGRHRIRIKIGEGQPLNSVFVGRRPTGEVYDPELACEHPDRDWILSRILWLTGCESGFNRGGSVDSLRRYIYIHGTPDTEPMGLPASHGCVRMRNCDLLELFDKVQNGCTVNIESGPFTD